MLVPDAVTQDYITRLESFMRERVYPAESQLHKELSAAGAARWSREPATLTELKSAARQAGLWNLFLPSKQWGAGLSNAQYAPLAEIMGRVHFASEIFNCSPPDTGNIEILEHFGSEQQKATWLKGLLDADIRSAFLMTEPDVASSDATNIECTIAPDGDEFVISGKKWWSTGAGDFRTRVFFLLGKSVSENADGHGNHSMVIFDADTPGVEIVRQLPVFGFDHAPQGHAEVHLNAVRIPRSALLGKLGQGFAIAQTRLGPGRIHHCMRAVGAAERGLEKMCKRLLSRTAFGKELAANSIWDQRIAQARVEIECSRLLTLHAARILDEAGPKAAHLAISMIKVKAPATAVAVLDDAIQAHGGAGLTTDEGLASAYADARSLRILDGPDEVHWRTIARRELRQYR
jgi:alkylation response protein AidB-like acyl-CoA dehydrogenase